MKKVTYSAPAKVILSGEHGVVYGKPAFVSAIDLRLHITVQAKETQQHEAQISKAFAHINSVVTQYLKKEKIAITDELVYFSLDNKIPLGRGMGSSAALSVAGCAALLHYYTGGEYTKEVVNQLAYSCEKAFHGNPSGVDNSTSCFGGLIFFRKEFEFLKNISALNFKLPKNIEDNLFLIDTGKPTESTAEMVALVGKNYNKDSQKMEKLLQQLEKITKRMVVAVVKEDKEFFSQCLSENGKILEEIGVVSVTSKALLESFAEYGVGKITGAGGYTEGSGYALFFAHDAEQFKNYLEKKEISYLKFKQDFEGVRKELV